MFWDLLWALDVEGESHMAQIGDIKGSRFRRDGLPLGPLLVPVKHALPLDLLSRGRFEHGPVLIQLVLKFLDQLVFLVQFQFQFVNERVSLSQFLDLLLESVLEVAQSAHGGGGGGSPRWFQLLQG